MKIQGKLIVLFIVILIGTTSVSLAGEVDSLGTAIKDNRQVSHLFAGSEGVLMGMSRSIFDVIRYVVLAGAVIRLFALYMEYANVGDNPQIIASIKTKSLWYVLGILFVLNFWSIVEFANDVLSKIEL